MANDINAEESTSTSSSAFAKAQELQGQAAREQSEAERLREEVLATRKARQSRIASKGGSISSMSGVAETALTPSDSPSTTTTFQPRNTSFPVSKGSTDSSNGSSKPTSLAHFIGGSKAINGPILNKQRPHLLDGAGLETDDLNKPTETFMSKMMKHGEGLAGEGGPGGYARKGQGVGLPGMVRPSSAATTSQKKEEEEEKQPLTHPNALEKPKEIVLPSRSPTIPTSFSASITSPTTLLSINEGTKTINPSSAPLLAPKPVKPINASTIAAAGASSSSSSKPDCTLLSSSLSPANNASSTPSLTRLKGSNLVKERLKWGEERASSANSSPSSSPVPASSRTFGAAASPAASPKLSGNTAPKGQFGNGSSPALLPKSSMSPYTSTASTSEPSPTSTPKAAKRSSVLNRYNPSANSGDSVTSTYKASYGVSPAASPKIGSSSNASKAPERLPSPPASKPAAEAKKDEMDEVKDGVAALSLDKDDSDDEEGPVRRRNAGFADDDDEFAIPTRQRQASGDDNKKQSTSDYKASYGVGAPSRQTSSVPSLKVNTESPEPEVKDYQSSYGVKSPVPANPASRSASGFDKPSPSPSTQQKSGSTSFASSSAMTNNREPPVKSSSCDYKGSYGVPIARTASPLSLASVTKDTEEDADTAKSGSSTDYKSSYGVGVSKSSYGSGSSATGFPRPSSAASNSGTKPAGSFSSISPISPKPSLNLPISVSPQPYQKPASPSPTSPRSFQPSASSYPVSLGLAPTHNKPTSLAHFIGGKQSVTGPILNKVRPEQMDGSGLEVYMGEQDGKGLKTFLGDANLLKETKARKEGGAVALPGMAKAPLKGSQPKKPSYGNWGSERTVAQEAASQGVGVAMPGMVRSPSPASTTQQQVQSPALSPATQSGRSTPAASLPLPGQASPKLPLPGQDLPTEEAQSQEDNIGQEKHTPQDITGAQSSILDPVSHNNPPSPVPTCHLSNEEDTPDDPTMSRLLREGYSTSRSLESVQPSDTTPIYERPSAMTINKHILHHQELSNPPSMQTADDGKKTVGKSRHDWKQTVKALGRPARHAPTPPAASPISSNSVDNAKYLEAKRAIEAEFASLSPFDLRIFERPVKQTPYIKYISIDILQLAGSSSKTLPMPCDTFYSSDLLCIVLRSKQGGVVDTDLILWRGKHNLAGEGEEKKVKELESRYRTSAKEVKQGFEEESLVRALGGRLVIRQGSRSTFDILNTTMYRVQSPSNGNILIDEVELHASSLCSAFSYVASVFEELYVWHGKGSKASEQAAARAYAAELAQNSRQIIDMQEGQEESLFKDIMGEEDYASANHWRYRDYYLDSFGIYSVQAESKDPIVHLASTEVTALPSNKVLLLDLPFEIYLLLPSELDRHRQQDASMALKVAERLAEHRHRKGLVPFKPPLHFLLLPSLLPLDLKAYFRNSALDDLSGPRRPTDMRLLDDQEIYEYLQTLSRS